MYLGLRDDKPADDVRRERPPMPPSRCGAARTLRFSNLDKPFWPEEGITKGDLLAYYRDVAEALVPHLRSRPFTMKRYPDGWHGKSFFQKNAPTHMPSWIKRAPFPASTRDGEKRIIDYALLDDELALLWAVSMGCIDLHAWCVTRRSARPRRLGDVRPRPVARRRLSGDGGGGVARPRDARRCSTSTVAPRRRGHAGSTCWSRSPGDTNGARCASSRRRRVRGGTRPSRARDHRVDEVEATRRADRRQPERPGSHECRRLLRPAARRRARVDAAALGRA